MSAIFLIQLFFNLAIIGLIMIMWLKLKRPPQDDPRLSRGLQLLQSKIAILSDLSDRSEKQVEDLGKLVEQKIFEMKTQIRRANDTIEAVDRSMQKSLEVAEIFQDKIPHEEILERRNTIQYVTAARMAHQGRSVSEIASELNLPRSEAELIVKLNRHQLMFDEAALPGWAQGSQSAEPGSSQAQLKTRVARSKIKAEAKGQDAGNERVDSADQAFQALSQHFKRMASASAPNVTANPTDV